MNIRYAFRSPLESCGYLPEQTQSLHYEIAEAMSAAEYSILLQGGWRRFGRALFRPECPTCRRCLSIRVPVATFRPDRSQSRAWKANVGTVNLEIGPPRVTSEKLALHDAFHAFQADAKGWPERGPQSAEQYADSFVDNPFATEEWCYRIDGRLVGVGYVDPVAAGLSAIYFFHDPAEKSRSLGTFNVLSVIEQAELCGLPHVYLGYYVAGCGSLEYKARFQPNEIRDPETGNWTAFQSRS